VRLSDGRFHYQRETVRFNAEFCWSFLRSLRRTHRSSKRRIVVIADSASSHHAVLYEQWRFSAELDFQLDHLPSYSPELCPIERLWEQTRRL